MGLTSIYPIDHNTKIKAGQLWPDLLSLFPAWCHHLLRTAVFQLVLIGCFCVLTVGPLMWKSETSSAYVPAEHLHWNEWAAILESDPAFQGAPCWLPFYPSLVTASCRTAERFSRQYHHAWNRKSEKYFWNGLESWRHVCDNRCVRLQKHNDERKLSVTWLWFVADTG